MSKPFIVIGDKTSHGGTVVGGATTATTHGKVIARVGDKVTCPKCGSTTIATGDNTMIIMGQPVARHGDKTACGATLIAGQSVTTTGGSGGESRSSTSRPPASSNTDATTRPPTPENRAPAAPVPTAGSTAAVTSDVSAADASESPVHALSFRLSDEATGVPLARQPVRLIVDGAVTETTTDDNGLVQAIHTGNAPKHVECNIMGIAQLHEEG